MNNILDDCYIDEYQDYQIYRGYELSIDTTDDREIYYGIEEGSGYVTDSFDSPEELRDYIDMRVDTF